jgi:hypothetical protein
MILETLSKVNEWKNQKKVVKLLQEYAGESKKELGDIDFIKTFIARVQNLGLMGGKLPKVSSLETELKACLIRL